MVLVVSAVPLLIMSSPPHSLDGNAARGPPDSRRPPPLAQTPLIVTATASSSSSSPSVAMASGSSAALLATAVFTKCRQEQSTTSNLSALAACAREFSPPLSKCASLPGSWSSTKPLVLSIAPAADASLSQIVSRLVLDPSFRVGMGVSFVALAPDAAANIVIITATSPPPPPPLLPPPPPPATLWKPQCTVALPSSAPAISSSEALYGAARAEVADLLAHSLPPPAVRLCVLLVWAGTKPPPARMVDVAKSFVDGGAARVLVLVEAPFVAEMRARALGDSLTSSKVTVVDSIPDQGNLTRFLHHRVDELVPEVRGHHHYPLGWGLCDFRWLFGDIFSHWLSEEEYTHWAWADSDAFASREMMSGPLTDYARDFDRHDVVSFASFGTGKDFYVTTMLAYTSGTFAAFHNTAKGRSLYRRTPVDVLVKGLSKANNQVLDESLVPNAVLGSDGVTVALSTAQARNKNIVATASGRLFYIAPDEAAMAELARLAAAGRVVDPMGVASLGKATVKGRFNGGRSLPGQTQDKFTAEPWMPRVDPSAFEFNKGIGSGFASLLRDSDGAWWHRPMSWRGVVWATDALVSRVELAVAHLRSGRPCVVDDAWLRNIDSESGFRRKSLVNAATACVDAAAA